jgi:hypothetical protein
MFVQSTVFTLCLHLSESCNVYHYYSVGNRNSNEKVVCANTEQSWDGRTNLALQTRNVDGDDVKVPVEK